ncbi:MAG: hypothetical protein Q4D13_03890 [Erysipelotrichaceae bacterium]|nr:hypothetical protein [Erysipelotrichaceae bacterium]
MTVIGHLIIRIYENGIDEYLSLTDSQKQNVKDIQDFVNNVRDNGVSIIYKTNLNNADGVNYGDGFIEIDPTKATVEGLARHEVFHSFSIQDQSRIKDILIKVFGQEAYDNIYNRVISSDGYQRNAGESKTEYLARMEEETTAHLLQDAWGDQRFINEVSQDSKLLHKVFNTLKYNFGKAAIDNYYGKAIDNLSNANLNSGLNRYSKLIKVNKTNGDIDYVEIVPFSDVVDKYYDNTGSLSDYNQHIISENTPSIILENADGLNDYPILIDSKHLINTMSEDVSHAIEKDTLKAIPDLIKHPFAIYKNSKHNSINLVLEATGKNGNAIIVSIKPNENGRYNNLFVKTNKASSLFNAYDNAKYIGESINSDDEILFPKGITKRKLVELMESEYPKRLSTNFTYNISNDNQNVKYSKAISDYDNAIRNNDLDKAGEIVKQVANEELSESKARDEDGDLVELYHSSPSDKFYVFDKERANYESDWGGGFYFSNKEEDANTNYHEGGADIENRISRLAERIQSNEDIDYDEAEQRAREEIIKGGADYKVFLNLKNPLVIENGKKAYILELQNAIDQYPDISIDDFSSEEEYYDEIIYQFVEDLGIDYMLDSREAADVKSAISQYIMEDGVDVNYFKEDINNMLMDAYDYERDQLMANQVVKSVIEQLGYDGIIDKTVSSKFVGMNLDNDTTHYIAFEPNQIKSADPITYDDNGNIIPLSERFNLNNNDIRYSKSLDDSLANQSEIIDTKMKRSGVSDNNIRIFS